MPVFTQHSPAVTDRDNLVAQLAAEIKGDPSATGEARVYEDVISQTRTFHVLVIWDRWTAVPRAGRAGIIYDAYESVDPAKMLRVKFAFGFTYDEAVAEGYLPYKVEPMVRDTDPVDRTALRERMLQLGARPTASGIELRYPYRSLADQAVKELEAAFGHGLFALAQEVGSVGRWAKA